MAFVSFRAPDFRFRFHHFACLGLFIGDGYGRAEASYLSAVTARLTAGQTLVEIVAGPDDICACCGGQGRGCHESRIVDRDAEAQMVLNQLPSVMGWKVGTVCRYDASVVGEIREAYARGLFRGMCKGCQKLPACSEIVQEKGDRWQLFGRAPVKPSSALWLKDFRCEM